MRLRNCGKRPRRLTVAAPWLAAALVFAVASPAMAHGVRLFARAGEHGIEGYVYVSGGGRVPGTTVEVADAEGAIVAELTTDHDGRFRFSPAMPGPHRFTVETQDGHRAESIVAAVEAGSDEADPHPPTATNHEDDHLAGAEGPAEPIASHDLEALVERAVQRQLAPLHEELDRYTHRVRIHDIIGGIGYIVGATGLLALVKRRPSSSGSGSDTPHGL